MCRARSRTVILPVYVETESFPLKFVFGEMGNDLSNRPLIREWPLPERLFWYSCNQLCNNSWGIGLLVYRNYLPAFHHVDPQLERTAGIFTTFPAFPALPQAGFLDQVIGTALLLLFIFAITDEFNLPPGANLAPLMVGLVVVAIGMSFGGMHGYAINPARDFGPRLFTVVAGFRNNGMTDGSRVWWVPIVAPLVGGVVGAAVYDFGIRRFLRSSS
jgi:glycerol uptake facilitator-like aquaporin